MGAEFWIHGFVRLVKHFIPVAETLQFAELVRGERVKILACEGKSALSRARMAGLIVTWKFTESPAAKGAAPVLASE